MNAPVLRCAGCGCIAEDRPDWLGLIGRDPDRSNRPMVGMYCPPCAEREFQWRPALGMRTGYL